VDGIASLLRLIAAKDSIGATLAEGIRHASREWGLDDLAIHVKGLEPAGYDPRVLKGMALAYATSGRGACHLRATFYKPELAGMIAPEQIEGKAELFSEWEDRVTIHDTLVICKFFRDLYLWEGLSTIVRGTTGMDLGQEGLRAVAGNILSEVRRFNLREGMTEVEESLPRRFFDEGLTDSGKRLDDDYYRVKGWTAPGR
jgi:aldehyde:ferredoxin oxidoreductase